MKNVLVVVWSSYTNDNRVIKISSSLFKHGYSVKVLASKEHKGLKVHENHGFDVMRIPLFSSLYSYGESHSHRKIGSVTDNRNSNIIVCIKKNRIRLMVTAFLNWLSFNIGVLYYGLKAKPSIVYANDLDTLTVSLIISKLSKAKLVFDSHELWLSGAKYLSCSSFRKKIWKFIHNHFIHKADEVIVTTESRAVYLQKKLLLEKINVIMNCPQFSPIKNHDHFRDEFPIDKKTPILLYQGSLIRKRGIFTLVDVAESIDNVAVVFMGMGNDKMELQKYIKEKRIDNRIFIKDAVPADKVVEFVSSADVGFQIFKYTLNHYTVISNKLFECIMAGIAVIGSNFPEIRKIITSNNIGLVVDPDDQEEIKKAIHYIVDDEKRLADFKRNSRRIRENYTWEIEEKKLISIIEGLTE